MKVEYDRQVGNYTPIPETWVEEIELKKNGFTEVNPINRHFSK